MDHDDEFTQLLDQQSVLCAVKQTKEMGGISREGPVNGHKKTGRANRANSGKIFNPSVYCRV